MELKTPTEEVSLIVSFHPTIRLLKGWRLYAIIMACAAAGSMYSQLILPGLLTLIFFWYIRSKLLRRKQITERPGKVDPSRLRCFGNPDELELLRDLAPDFFDPFVVQSSSFVQPGGVFVNPAAKSILFMIAVIALFIALKSHQFSDSWILGFYSFVFLAILFISYHGFPIYYRITPGKLEMLTSGFVSRDLQLRCKLDLTKAKITCNFGSAVMIHSPNDQAVRILLEHFSNEEEYEFIRTLFTAAISPFESPDLPTNALTG
ncbi:MAG: hypothetical protein DHS20C16_00130 [Phycisphaerae bacterium]|nr:MAG: hypothetical protein DHS20C16_00130 [Phycisphaerae bacterium]